MREYFLKYARLGKINFNCDKKMPKRLLIQMYLGSNKEKKVLDHVIEAPTSSLASSHKTGQKRKFLEHID